MVHRYTGQGFETFLLGVLMAMNMFTGLLDGGVLEHLPDSIYQIEIGPLRVGVELGVEDTK
jgi:hypothetical protein